MKKQIDEHEIHKRFYNQIFNTMKTESYLNF